jgi:hypothetical protein
VSGSSSRSLNASGCLHSSRLWACSVYLAVGEQRGGAC